MERRVQRWFLTLLVFALFVLLYRSLGREETAPPVSHGGAVDSDLQIDPSSLEPANRTLGFGAVVAVSRAASPRRESLLLAANITEIDITIPTQPVWTDDDLSDIRAEHDSKISRGSALAWLGHLNAMRWFLSTDLETMLVLEDDVDWDIHLRTVQIPHAAAAIRQLVRGKAEPPGELAYRPPWNNYWGRVSSWDILYLGHCGDIFRPSSWSHTIPRVMYPDTTLPPRREMHPYSTKFLESIDIPEDTRLIHQSIFPLCTFGVAYTRSAAYRMLTTVASREPDGGTMAYDVRVLEACRDLGFQCWSANPELFHHMDSESEIAIVDSGRQGGEAEPEKAGADEKGRLKPLRAGRAPNIACGARSKDFFTRDPETIKYLQEEVGRKGICLRDTLEEDASKSPGWRPPEHYTGPDDPRLG